MGRDTDQKEIDGYIYEVKQLGFKQSRRLLIRIGRVLAPIVGALLKSEGTTARQKFSLASIDSRAVGKMLDGVAAALDENDMDYVCGVLGPATRYWPADGQGEPQTLTEVVQDHHFRGRNLAALKWLRFALELQFGDFSEAARSLKDAPPTEGTAAVGVTTSLPA